ncbi:MAG: hypothetical protein IT535_06635 [Bauldia sp.]|nr:hypothetical protein [Bauldia sp.]
MAELIRLRKAKALRAREQGLVIIQGEGPLVLDRAGERFACARCGAFVVHGRLPGGKLTPVFECRDCGTHNIMPVHDHPEREALRRA